jgi:hypothetical protein
VVCSKGLRWAPLAVDNWYLPYSTPPTGAASKGSHRRPGGPVLQGAGHQNPSLEAPAHFGSSSNLPCLIIRLIIQTIPRDPSRSVQIDDASNVSRPDPSGADQIDAEHQATDLAIVAACVGPGVSPPASIQAVWLDSAPDLTCTNSTQAYCVDADHQPTDLAVGHDLTMRLRCGD